MICTNCPLHGSKRGGGRSLNAFAADQNSSGCSLCSGRSSDFLRHHAPALHIGSSTASEYAGQTQRDDALGIKPDLRSIGPKFPRSVHLSHQRKRDGDGRTSSCANRKRRALPSSDCRQRSPLHPINRVAAFVRIRWPLSIGLGGRFPSESVAAFPRIPQGTSRLAARPGMLPGRPAGNCRPENR
jgi:hypothetical protein